MKPARGTSSLLSGKLIFAGIVAGVGTAAGAFVAAPALLPDSYDWMRHSISESAAQGVAGAWLARAGLLLFGLSVVTLTSVAARAWEAGGRVLHGLFGVCMLAVAAFSHRSWEPGVGYDQTEDLLHSIAATVMGFAFAFGVIVVAIRRRRPAGRYWLLDALAVSAAVVLPIGMSVLVSYAGVLQRAMFGIGMVWYVAESARILLADCASPNG